MPLSVLVEQRLISAPLLQESFSLGVRLNSTVKDRFIVDQSMCGWCHFSTAITLHSQFLLRNDK